MTHNQPCTLSILGVSAVINNHNLKLFALQGCHLTTKQMLQSFVHLFRVETMGWDLPLFLSQPNKKACGHCMALLNNGAIFGFVVGMGRKLQGVLFVLVAVNVRICWLIVLWRIWSRFRFHDLEVCGFLGQLTNMLRTSLMYEKNDIDCTLCSNCTVCIFFHYCSVRLKL